MLRGGFALGLNARKVVVRGEAMRRGRTESEF